MFLRIGHRGARSHEPENTIASFRRAIGLGANAIELDVRATSDGKIIVMHDPDVRRTTNGRGFVRRLALKRIRELKAGGQKVPTLEEALDFIDGKVDRIFIELKEVGLEKRVLAAVKKRKLQKRVVLTSFKEKALANVRKLDRSTETGLVYIAHPNPVKAALKLGVGYLIPFYLFVRTRDVEKAHENGLKVVVWVINGRAKALRLMKKGVDGIMSDRPELLGRN